MSLVYGAVDLERCSAWVRQGFVKVYHLVTLWNCVHADMKIVNALIVQISRR